MIQLSVTVSEAVQMTGIGRSSLYELFKEKKLIPRKSGNRTLILVEDLKRYVENLPAAS